MAELSMREEAEDCRRRALTYVGLPEGPFLLRLAEAFEDLSREDNQPTREGSTSFAGRQSDRVRVDAWLFMQRAGEVRFKTQIYDISPEGCLLELVSRPRIGDRVRIKIENMESLEAVVCWIDGHKCGSKFEAPLHPAVFSSIIGNYERRRSVAPTSSSSKAYG
jgi:hypothetical protein